MGRRMKAVAAKVCYIPQRYILGIMGALAVLNAYTTRVSLSIAITQMVQPKNASQVHDDSCPFEEGAEEEGTVEVKEALYKWSEMEQGLLLGAFFLGYLVSHMPGGILSDMYGGKHVLGGGMAINIALTILTPLIVIITNGCWWVLAIVRMLEGLGQGVLYPALSTLLARWVPKRERSFIGTLSYSGANFGTILSNFVSGYTMHATESWQSVFYLWGSVGLLWLIFWYILCYSIPNTHPYISEKEADFLEKELGTPTTKHKIPWKPMLLSAPNWALIAAQVGHDWGLFMIITDLPKYMNDVLKFDIRKNGLWTSIPYIFMYAVSIASGLICDVMINRKWISISWARKLFTTIASAGPAVFLMLAVYVGCDKTAASWMFTIAMAFMGTFYCGLKVNAIDLAPNFAGILMALNNGIGAITGFAAPFAVGILTPNHTLGEWRIVFWITFGILHVTNVIYLIWASGTEQWWNNPEQGPQPDASAAGGAK